MLSEAGQSFSPSLSPSSDSVIPIGVSCIEDETTDRLTITGKDATESFEDVGHSDEARKQLEPLLIGEFKGEVSVSLYLVLSCKISSMRRGFV